MFKNKTVIKFNLEGEEVARFDKAIDAANDIEVTRSAIQNNLSKTSLTVCVLGEWRYKHLSFFEGGEVKLPKIERESKGIVQFDFEGNKVEEFEDIDDLIEKIGYWEEKEMYLKSLQSKGMIDKSYFRWKKEVEDLEKITPNYKWGYNLYNMDGVKIKSFLRVSEIEKEYKIIKKCIYYTLENQVSIWNKFILLRREISMDKDYIGDTEIFKTISSKDTSNLNQHNLHKASEKVSELKAKGEKVDIEKLQKGFKISRQRAIEIRDLCYYY